MTANPNRINGETIRILEAEGLGSALNTVGRVLARHGTEKHGLRRWSTKRYREHFRKAIRHLSTEGKDTGGSEEPHTANGIARALFMLAMELRK